MGERIHSYFLLFYKLSQQDNHTYHNGDESVEFCSSLHYKPFVLYGSGRPTQHMNDFDTDMHSGSKSDCYVAPVKTPHWVQCVHVAVLIFLKSQFIIVGTVLWCCCTRWTWKPFQHIVSPLLLKTSAPLSDLLDEGTASQSHLAYRMKTGGNDLPGCAQCEYNSPARNIIPLFVVSVQKLQLKECRQALYSVTQSKMANKCHTAKCK